ncbi:hypothetical protein U1Q18_031115, partial [Sarracenia purpurea var. burkii]
MSSRGRDTHHRRGDNSNPSGPEAITHGQGGVARERGEGSWVPATEGVSAIEEIFREPSVFDEDSTGLGFIEQEPGYVGIGH